MPSVLVEIWLVSVIVSVAAYDDLRSLRAKVEVRGDASLLRAGSILLFERTRGIVFYKVQMFMSAHVQALGRSRSESR